MSTQKQLLHDQDSSSKFGSDTDDWVEGQKLKDTTINQTHEQPSLTPKLKKTVPIATFGQPNAYIT